MEPTMNSTRPTRKMYADTAIMVGTFFGGPPLAGYMIAENFKAFNRKEMVWKTWVFVLITTLVVHGGMMLIGTYVYLPVFSSQFAWTVTAYPLIQRYQKHEMDLHVQSGGQVHSWWRTIGMCVLILVVYALLGFIALLTVKV